MCTRPPPDGSIVWGDPDELELTPAANEDWIAAIHEAGHAVIALALGFQLKDITIDNAYQCRIQLDLPEDEPPHGISTPSISEVERDALYTLAGGKAEVRWPLV